jgi:hypothetical protein
MKDYLRALDRAGHNLFVPNVAAHKIEVAG